MTNLNSYTIENYQYRVGDSYMFGNEELKIESIMNVNDSVFFFCSKTVDNFLIKIGPVTTVQCSIMPIHCLVFHNRVKLTVTVNE
jgi:hypothetical protein